MSPSEKYFHKLMDHNLTLYDEMTNEMGQRVEFYEHPIYGDEHPVIIVFPDERVAFTSDFYETDDMMDEQGDYRPFFYHSTLYYGYELPNELFDEMFKHGGF